MYAAFWARGDPWQEVVQEVGYTLNKLSVHHNADTKRQTTFLIYYHADLYFTKTQTGSSFISCSSYHCQWLIKFVGFVRPEYVQRTTASRTNTHTSFNDKTQVPKWDKPNTLIVLYNLVKCAWKLTKKKKKRWELRWQKEAAPASKTNNEETDNVYYLCPPCHRKWRCTVRNPTPFMWRPLWWRGDKLTRKGAKNVCAPPRLFVLFITVTCADSPKHITH